MASSIDKTQFVINGAPFETLLGQSPTDPLILMLARGPAGFRFTAKALQHAMPDAKLERGDIVTDGDPFKIAYRAMAVGKAAWDGEAVNALVSITLKLAGPGTSRRRSHGRPGGARTNSPGKAAP